MTFALSVILKTTILLACASLMTLGLRRASASTRHTVWAIALLCALVLPFASVTLPEIPVAVLPEEMFESASPALLRNSSEQREAARSRPATGGSTIPTPPIRSQSISGPPPQEAGATIALSLGQWLGFLWAAGASVILIRLAVGSLTVRQLARRSVVIEDPAWLDILDDLKANLSLGRTIRLRIARGTIPPMTWGIFRHVVLLPASAAEWTQERRRLVLAHELAHVKRNDGILQMLLQAVCSLYWFNPLVWYAARKLRIERECACDDRVLQLGADADDYADHLLQVARTINPGGGLSMATVAMAHRSQLETRLLSILDTRTRRKSVSRLATAALLCGVAAITLFAAALQVTAKPGTLSLDFKVPGLPADLDLLMDPIEQAPLVVNGSVREFGTGVSLGNVLVTLVPLQTQDNEPVVRYDAESRADGTFSIKDVPPGQYRVTLLHGAFVRLHSSAEPTQLTLFHGQTPEKLRFHMMRGPAISGRVFDEGGSLKAAAHVELLRADVREGQRTLLPSDISMITDSHGEYRLPGLEQGEYYLRVRPRTGSADFLPVYFPGVTDPRFATPISVRAGADISGIDLSLTRGNLHSVRLKIEIATPAPPNPELSFYINPRRTSGTAASGGSVPAGASQFHNTAANTYVSPLLAPGSYEIEVYLRDPEPIRWARTSVEIDDRDVDAGTLVIGPGVWIEGNIIASESLPVNLRRGQLHVILRPLDGSTFLLPSAQVAADGSFVIPRVPERHFRVDVTGLPPEIYLSSARYGGREVRDSGFTVSASARSVLDLAIAGSGGVVAGVVRGTKDEPIRNGTVVLIPMDKSNPNLYRTAPTDQFGVYSIAGVQPGEYGVLAWKEGSAKSYLDPVFIKTVENQAQKVKVRKGFTNTINLVAIAP
jgi:beta-lactamase regulating signal transducer with metallopeptidase domain